MVNVPPEPPEPPESPEETEKARVGVDEFAHALGAAIIAWQQVERYLFSLFVVICEIDEGGKHGVTYHAINSSEVKLAIIDALLKLRTEDEGLLEKWGTLQKKIKRRRLIRDKLAHWSVVTTSSVDGKFAAVYLTRPITDRRIMSTFPKPQSGAMNVDELKKCFHQFVETAEEILDFIRLFLRST